jgi:diguanylate cyclase (GGDEF)-like protein/PAS domain S-box-containing protein
MAEVGVDQAAYSDFRHRTAVIAAVAVICVGVFVCTMWVLSMPDATRLLANSSSVRFNTGLSFILGGTGLLLALRRHRHWAPAVIVPLLLLASLSLLQYLLGWSVDIDNLFIPGDTVAYPGRMAPNTAVGLLMAALGLVGLVSANTRIWALSISAMLAVLTGALGLMAAIGYVLDVTAAFEWAGLPRMALLTAIGLVVLGAGILLATGEVGRVASWIEQPWLASTVGVGAAGLGLLAVHALRSETPGWSERMVDGLDAAVVVFAALLAGTVAQARHMRLLSLKLAAANRSQAELSAEITDLYENAPCGYHSLDDDARFVRINRTLLDWLGYEFDEVVGRRTLPELLTPESGEDYLSQFTRLKQHGEVRGLPLELLRKDGSTMPVVLSETAVYDARGTFLRSRSTLFDDAERRRFEQELRDSEQRLQLLIDTVQTAVVVHAGDSSIEFANPSAAHLLGLTREQMQGRKSIDPSWHFVREDGSPMPVDEYPVSRVIRSGRPLRGYVTGVHVVDAEPIRWMLVDAVPAFGKDGQLRQIIVSFIDISEQLQQKQHLEQLASTDTLTGLSTRRQLLELAGHELARARRSHRPLALVFLDVDHFKSINDRFGHDTGDRVLQRIGDVLHRELRAADLAARWGGEEFCALLPDTDLRAATDIAERLRTAVERMPFAAPDGSPLPVTASFGVAISRPDDNDLRRLADAADQAMYRAKQEGRNRVCVARFASAGPESAR